MIRHEERPGWLIRDAGLMFSSSRVDVRVRGAQVTEIGKGLPPQPGERQIDAVGAALLPGLHDHHLHIRALAAESASVHCGPPRVGDEATLQRALRSAPGGDTDWLRGVGYHESVAGDIDRHWIDRHVRERPVRIQHNSGRMWILNSAALERIAPPSPGAPAELRRAYQSGRFIDLDSWLRSQWPAALPRIDVASRRLAAHGVTGLTDATHSNNLESYELMAASQDSEELRQKLVVMGDHSLDHAPAKSRIAPGPTKFHLHENALPQFTEMVGLVERSHASRRPVAVHCVTVETLAFALAALVEAGTQRGDRIEHGSLIPTEWVHRLRDAGLTIVTQPGFVFERGDRYREDLEPTQHDDLYRVRSLLQFGIPVALSTDAPFGDPNPWKSMQAAVDRATRSGHTLGQAEKVCPEQACRMFMGAGLEPAQQPDTLRPGMTADLCLLDQSWGRARGDLARVSVRLTLRDGEVIHASEDISTTTP